MAERLVAVGVDGATEGWIAAGMFATARRRGGGSRMSPFDVATPKRTELCFFEPAGGQGALERLNEWRVRQPGGDDAPVAIDVPIGLPELGGSRPCDYECRAAIPDKSSSVFPPPARFLVEHFETADVTKEQLWAAIAERRHEEAAAGCDPDAVAGMTSQSCAFFDKVWETDRFVRTGPHPDGSWPVEEWLFEVHPELCFQRMHDATLARAASGHAKAAVAGPWPRLSSKKRARGALQRVALVRQHFPDVEQRVRDLDWSATGNLDDPLDAYAALWTAMRVAQHGFEGVEVLGSVLGDAGGSATPRDAGGTGLLMRMVA